MPWTEKKVERVFTGMEIDEALDYHITSWKMQPVAWSIIGLFVLAGVLGLFGTGILSKASKQQGKVRIEYERFFRVGTIMKMEIRDETGTPETEITFPSSYLSYMNIQSTVPDPSGTEISDGLVKYIFKTGSPRRQVVFYLQPEKPGTAKGSIRVNNEDLHLSQLIFP